MVLVFACVPGNLTSWQYPTEVTGCSCLPCSHCVGFLPGRPLTWTPLWCRCSHCTAHAGSEVFVKVLQNPTYRRTRGLLNPQWAISADSKVRADNPVTNWYSRTAMLKLHYSCSKQGIRCPCSYALLLLSGQGVILFQTLCEFSFLC